MRVAPVKFNYSLSFNSRTAYYENKVVEQDAATLEKSKSYYSNPVSPNQDFIGFNLIRQDSKNIFIKSRYNHVIGKIQHNLKSDIPKINIIGGSHQPVIELVDDELGIKILLNRGSKLTSPDLNIDYQKIDNKKIFVDKYKNISFGNNLVVVSGYKSKDTNAIVNNYVSRKKFDKIQPLADAALINNNYTIVVPAAGYGTRLKPLSDLYDTNKPATRYPSTGKTLLEMSALIPAAGIGKIQKTSIITEDEDNLSGTAGAIIKGLKNKTIPLNKPLVILTSDTFHNINIARALKEFEKDGNVGIGVVVRDVSDENLFNVPLVEIGDNNEIKTFYEKINSENYYDIIHKNNKFYTSTNIMIIHPYILKYLEKFADENGNADFLEFLALMQNVLNKSDENLLEKYPYGLGNKELKIEDIVTSNGMPKKVYANYKAFDFSTLKVKAIPAQGINLDKPQFSDIGTIENFIQTVREIKNSPKISGISSDFINDIKASINDNGVIFMEPDAKEKYEKFLKKYNITNLEGNVIVSSFNSKNFVKDLTKKVSPLAELAKQNPDKFVEEIMNSPDNLKEISKELIEAYGLKDFLHWYLSDEGYYGAYEKYVEKLFKNAKSIDELLKFMPNWSPWKLEEKYWSFNRPYVSYMEPSKLEQLYKKDCDTKREQPFTIGKLPSACFEFGTYEELISTIRNENIENKFLTVNGIPFTIKKLKGGDLNDKNIYYIAFMNDEYILKTDRSYAEDNDFVWMYDKKTIKKNKVLMADSNFTNACISKYLELNGCKNIPKLYFYDYKTDTALYEYVKDANGDLYQKGLIDTEHSDLNLYNDVIKNLREKGIYLNDTALKNFFKEADGTEKIIDLGHANFIMPFKPGLKYYNVEFANTNGPDLRTIYASFL